MKKLLCKILVIVMVLSMAIPFTAFAAAWDGSSKATAFAGGTGAEADPYQIATAEQLAYLAASVNGGETYSGKFFKLTADIDLGSKEWTPIGTDNTSNNDETKRFKGIFDGNGKTISNLTVKSGTHIGLFGSCQDATIKNLTLTGVDLANKDFAGAISGTFHAINKDAVIYNCVVNGKVAGKAVGGFVGRSYGKAGVGNIKMVACVNNASVSNEASLTNTGCFVGGLVGCAGSVDFFYCINNGAVTSTDKSTNAITGGIGGHVGLISTTTVNYCINTGAITAPNSVGGIAGRMPHASGITAKMIGCVNLGVVTDNSATEDETSGHFRMNDGSLIGNIYRPTYELTNNYALTEPFVGGASATNSATYDATKAGQHTLITDASKFKGAALNTSLGLTGVFEGTTTTTVNAAAAWTAFNAGSTTPDTPVDPPANAITPATAYAGGLGTEADPFQIATAEQLARVQSLTAAGIYSGKYYYYKLTADIDLTGYEWLPIGDATNKFSGYFDGNGKTVKGLTVTNTSNQQSGLFGVAVDSTIKNLNVKGTTVVAATHAGAIVGLLDATKKQGSYIFNCTSDVTTITAKQIGGIAGRVQSPEKQVTTADAIYVIACVSNSNLVSGATTEYSGGIVGAAGSATIAYCINHGKLSNTAKPNKDVNYMIGGIVGIQGSNNGEVKIDWCINNGTVELTDFDTAGSKVFAGGIAGRAMHVAFSEITNCVSLGEVINKVETTEAGKRCGAFAGHFNKQANNLANNFTAMDLKFVDSFAAGMDVFVNEASFTKTDAANLKGEALLTTMKMDPAIFKAVANGVPTVDAAAAWNAVTNPEYKNPALGGSEEETTTPEEETTAEPKDTEEVTTVEDVTTEEATTALDGEETTATNKGTQSNKNKETAMIFVWVIVGVVALAAIAIVIVLVLGKKKEEN